MSASTGSVLTDVSVIVGYFGDRDHWGSLAQRALNSARAQTVEVEVIEMHGSTLHEARNAGAEAAHGDYLIFLDADDALDRRYVEAMLHGSADLRQPATLGVYPDGSEDAAAVNIPPKPIRQQNWLVIGSMVSAAMFKDAGGFLGERAWEDWAFWMRCFALGATWEPVPEAIYRVSVNPHSRNNTIDRPSQLFKEILRSNEQWAADRGLTIP